MNQFSAWLNKSMTIKKVSASSLSKSLGISQSVISLWRSSERRPNDENLVAVINHFCKTQSQKKTALYEIYFK